jgi:hypothetical protein
VPTPDAFIHKGWNPARTSWITSGRHSMVERNVWSVRRDWRLGRPDRRFLDQN